MPKQYDAYDFIGGLDVNTPYIKRSPGSLLLSLNYEPEPDGGYRLMAGYERFNGKQSPTDTVITALPIVNPFDATDVVIGDLIIGNDSDATGNYVGQDDEQLLLFVANAVGQFVGGETLNATETRTSGNSVSAAFAVQNEQFDELFRVGREFNRGNISQVPGSGPVRAVWEFNGDVYAWRDNASATECLIYRSSIDGWVLVDTNSNFTLSFAAGQGAAQNPFIVGDLVTGATSSATGTVTGVGPQAADRQAGYVSLSGVRGIFADGEALLVNGVTQATSSSEAERIRIMPGGNYQLQDYNFFGASGRDAIYFVNGQQTAFAFNGTALTPIRTGTLPDTPTDIVIHHDHLFLAFRGGSLIHSEIAEPLNFRGDLGAFAFALGSEITNLILSPQALIITTDDNVQVIYGNGVADWVKTYISLKSIGVANSGQYLGQPLIVDTSGVVALDKVDSFGNFQDALLSDSIRSILNRLAPTVTNSVINKFRNHYLFFTSSGQNILCGFANNQFVGFFPFTFDRPVNFASANERRLFFTSTEENNGFVYEFEKGTSFDGELKRAYLQTSYAFQGSPQRRKRYRRVTLSVNAISSFTINVSFSYDKGNGLTLPDSFSGELLGFGGRWDIANWNEIIWDGQDVPEIISDIDGVGTDLSMFLFSESTETISYTVEDIIIEYSGRSIKR